jgi:hypothetical protein
MNERTNKLHLARETVASLSARTGVRAGTLHTSIYSIIAMCTASLSAKKKEP